MAIAGYAVLSQAFSVANPNTAAPIVVPAGAGKQVLSWGVDKAGNTDLIVTGYPAADGTSCTFEFTEARGGPTASTGTLFVIVASVA
ncbi:MAG: hypothetical protein ACRDSN_02590 [Pseudonocardiaceae bacterium]